MPVSCHERSKPYLVTTWALASRLRQMIQNTNSRKKTAVKDSILTAGMDQSELTTYMCPTAGHMMRLTVEAVVNRVIQARIGADSGWGAWSC